MVSTHHRYGKAGALIFFIIIFLFYFEISKTQANEYAECRDILKLCGPIGSLSAVFPSRESNFYPFYDSKDRKDSILVCDSANEKRLVYDEFNNNGVMNFSVYNTTNTKINCLSYFFSHESHQSILFIPRTEIDGAIINKNGTISYSINLIRNCEIKKVNIDNNNFVYIISYIDVLENRCVQAAFMKILGIEKRISDTKSPKKEIIDVIYTIYQSTLVSKSRLNRFNFLEFVEMSQDILICYFAKSAVYQNCRAEERE